jgi:hypothetical protein
VLISHSLTQSFKHTLIYWATSPHYFNPFTGHRFNKLLSFSFFVTDVVLAITEIILSFTYSGDRRLYHVFRWFSPPSSSLLWAPVATPLFQLQEVNGFLGFLSNRSRWIRWVLSIYDELVVEVIYYLTR